MTDERSNGTKLHKTDNRKINTVLIITICEVLNQAVHAIVAALN